MGWAERLKKNKRLCAACEHERLLPHFIVGVGSICDKCYRRLVRVKERLDDTTHRAEFEWQSYETVGVWDGGI